MELEVYEKGNTFLIKYISYSDEESVEEKEQEFSTYLSEIEIDYKHFIQIEGKIDDGLSFVQFISDNTDDILGLLENKSSSLVDDRYATLIFFLEYLHKHNSTLFEIASQLFWSSIISAFLQSDVPLVKDSMDTEQKEYFLDTSILLGLLKLSTPVRENYALEVCDIIKKSGGILRINPMTIYEAKCILHSVEINSPNPLTDIASAYERYKLIPNDLAHLRINLESIVEKKGISIFPAMGKNEINKIISCYKGKEVVKLLGESRRKSESYSKDNYREIHDIYMDDYIAERKRAKDVDGQVYFLTANIDLMNFCRAMHPESNNMMSTGQVVLDLWMHNRKPVNMSGCALTEIMARCLDLHGMNVRKKIVEVAFFFNKTKDKIDSEVYKDFIAKLYSRAKNVISVVESEPNDKSLGDNWVKLISSAVAADNAIYNEAMANICDEKKKMQEEINTKNEEAVSNNQRILCLTEDNERNKREILGLNDENKVLQQDIDVLNKNITKVVEHNEKLQGSLKEMEENLKRTSVEKDIALNITKLYEKKEELNASLKENELKLQSLERKRVKSFCNWSPFVCLILGVLFIIMGVFCIIIYVRLDSASEKYIKCAVPLITIGGIVFGFYFHLDKNVENRRSKAYEKWASKPNNRVYNVLKSNIEQEKEHIKQITIELQDLKGEK